MRRYLSVDCGGTKTAFLLCRETGELEAAHVHLDDLVGYEIAKKKLIIIK